MSGGSSGRLLGFSDIPYSAETTGEKSLVQLSLDHSGGDSSPGRRYAPVIAHSFIEVCLPGCYGLFYGEK